MYLPVRSPLLRESTRAKALFLYFPHATEMFHFAWFPLNISHDIKACILQMHGFPHSEISGSKVVATSPKRIAGYRVFHRLIVPRHPPYTLLCFNLKLYRIIDKQFATTIYMMTKLLSDTMFDNLVHTTSIRCVNITLL